MLFCVVTIEYETDIFFVHVNFQKLNNLIISVFSFIIRFILNYIYLSLLENN
jgi:hypothetical protein